MDQAQASPSLKCYFDGCLELNITHSSILFFLTFIYFVVLCYYNDLNMEYPVSISIVFFFLLEHGIS